MNNRQKKLVVIAEITVSQHFDIPIYDLLARSRKEEITEARFFLFWVLTELAYLNSFQIADKYGRERTNINHAMVRVSELCVIDDDYNEKTRVSIIEFNKRLRKLK